MLKLIPPGKRKGNRFYIARGRIAGRQVEISTGTADKAAAERIASAALAELVKNPPAAAEIAGGRTFRDAAQAYCAFRNSGPREIREVNRLIRQLGAMPLDDIRHADLVQAADALYPSHKQTSRNRLVIAPAAAILHYAAEQEWCAYRRFKRFKEPRAETRAVQITDARVLVEAASGHLRALLVFLFGQGMRVTDAIAVTWEKIDLKAGTIEVRIGKTDQYRLKAIHPEAMAALAALPDDGGRAGKVFPYANRWAVYRALEPVLKAAGVAFTPHMARHSLGKWLNESGAGLRTIMDALDHADPKSSIRYQSTDVEGQKRALGKVVKLRGRTEGNAKKSA